MKGICLGGYLLGEELGHGKYGRVYEGADVHDSSLVFAVKVFYEQFFSDPNFRRRFNAEAKALYSLEHSNIVRYFHRAIVEYINEHGNVKEAVIIVTELVKGRTLEQILKKETLPKEQAINITLEILYALEHAHSKGVLHRDIHPGQVIVRDDGVVKVADFGLAKIAGISQEKGTITSTATAKGNRYAAPGGPKDERSDIYSVGMVFYEMMRGKDGTVQDKNLEKIILKATAAVLLERYQCATEFIAALKSSGKSDNFLEEFRGELASPREERKISGIAKYGYDFETVTKEDISRMNILQVCGYLKFVGKDKVNYFEEMIADYCGASRFDEISVEDICSFIKKYRKKCIPEEKDLKIVIALTMKAACISGLYEKINDESNKPGKQFVVDSIRNLERASTALPQDPQLHHLLGLYIIEMCSRHNKNFRSIADAEKHLETAHSLSGGDYEHDYLTASSLNYKEMGDVASAAENCEKLAELEHSPIRYLEASGLYEQAGNLEKAIAAVYFKWEDRQWNEKFEKRLAHLYYKTNQYRKCIKELYYAPAYPYPDTFRMSLLAHSFFCLGDHATAREICKDALASAPNNAYLHNLLGKCLFNSGYHRDGIRELGIASKLDPNNNQYQEDLERGAAY